MRKLLSLLLLLPTTFSCDLLVTNNRPNDIPQVSSTPISSANPIPVESTKADEVVQPVDITEFVQKYTSISKPEDVVKLFLDSIQTYLDPAQKEKGIAMIAVLINQDGWDKAGGGISFFRDKLKNMPYIFRSYAKGSTPENNYQMDAKNYEIEITRSEKIDDKTQKIFVKSSGADSPRPITLVKDTKANVWIVHEFSSIYVDVRKPNL